jgi:hypothetical protein
MKKMVFFLILLIFTRMGVSFGAGPSQIGIGNFFLGNDIANMSDSNLNQALGLLVGPSGAPGPAGVAGKNGFNGINGIDGMPGAPGPMGEPGPAGPAGAKGDTGATGAQGPTGATGAQGPAGPAGPAGNGADTQFGGGVVGVSVCGTQSEKPNLNFTIQPEFNGVNFVIASISVNSIPPSCNRNILKLYFKTQRADNFSKEYKDTKSPNYQAEVITCSYNIPDPVVPVTLVNKRSSGVALCLGTDSGKSIYLSDIAIADLDGTDSTNVGITITNP